MLPSETTWLKMADPISLVQFAEYPPDTLIDKDALAQALSVSARTLRRMVARFELPPPIKLGRRRYWVVGKLRAYLTERAATAATTSSENAARLRRVFGHQ